MKITKILEAPHTTNIIDRKSKGSLKKYSKEVGEQPSGMFSTIAKDREPHFVRKYSRNKLRQNQIDGFKQFVQYLLDTKNTDNPHFPRIYEMKTVRDKEGYRIESYRVEKLIEYTEIEPDILIQYALSLINGFSESDLPYAASAHLVLTQSIERAVNKANRPFKDDTLNDACVIVSDAIANLSNEFDRVVNDLHSGNVMYRRTPHGIQVVINDPIHIPYTEEI